MPRGRRPTPTTVKKKTGIRADKLNKREPKPLATDRTPPAHLDPIARDCWSEVTDLLSHMEILSRSDHFAIEAFATTYSRWRQAEESVSVNGLFYVTENGYERANPAIKMSNDSVKVLISLLDTLGLTPSARAKLTVPDEKGDDKLAEFINKIRRK